MDKLLDFRNVVSFLIFGCNEEGGGSKELKVFFSHLFFHEVLIDDHDNREESLREHFEPEMQVDNPIDEYASHVGFDFLLFRHVINQVVLFGF